MKTDLYTKFLLTIIAISLVIIILRDVNITPTATAQINTRPVMDVNIVSINGTRLQNGSFDVNVKNKVNIDIPYDGIDVNVKNSVEIKTPYRGIDVNILNYNDLK